MKLRILKHRVRLLILPALILIAGPAIGDPKDYLRPAEIPAPSNNHLTAARVDLGRVLFFDTRLSGNNQLSCATCHQQAKAWSDGLAKAKGAAGRLLKRTTPSLINVAYLRHLGWDGGFRSLEQQALIPITSADEMDQGMDELIAELGQVPKYQGMFDKAYPDEGINADSLVKALASFQRTLISGEAPFDRWLKGDEQAISESAKRGFSLFEGKANCISCHDGFSFTDGGFHNIGLPEGEDLGRFKIVPVPVLKRAFKTPTLREINLSAPYMHNGLYKTLAEVVDHYDRGGVTAHGLDPNMRPLFLSAQEKQDLIAFLHTLTTEVSLEQTIVGEK